MHRCIVMTGGIVSLVVLLIAASATAQTQSFEE